MPVPDLKLTFEMADGICISFRPAKASVEITVGHISQTLTWDEWDALYSTIINLHRRFYK